MQIILKRDIIIIEAGKAGSLMPKFIKDFLNIYVDEEQVREAYGDEYADRFSAVDPATGKKKISAAKIFKRLFILFLIGFNLLWIIRYLIVYIKF